jgi:hypothetical protein
MVWKWKWSWINFDTIAIFVIIIAVIYCLLTRKKKKHKFRGLGESGFDFQEANWNIPLRRKKKKRINKTEEKCREIFQRIFQRPFPSIRPDWLKSPATGRNLEIDGFCPDIETSLGKGLGFEYNGIQHSKYTTHFHRKGPQEFDYQCAKDDWKNAKCKDLGITLINIPHDISPHDLERHIKYKLKKIGTFSRTSRSSRERSYNSPFNMYH